MRRSASLLKRHKALGILILAVLVVVFLWLVLCALVPVHLKKKYGITYQSIHLNFKGVLHLDNAVYDTEAFRLEAGYVSASLFEALAGKPSLNIGQGRLTVKDLKSISGPRASGIAALTAHDISIIVRGRDIGSFNAVLSGEELSGTYAGPFFKASFSLSGNKVKAESINFPLLKNFKAEYNLKEEKGEMEAGPWRAGFRKSGDGFLVEGEGIDLEAGARTIRIRELAYKDFSMTGEADIEKKEYRGVIRNSKSKSITFTGTPEGVKAFSETGAQILYLNKNTVAADLFLKDIIPSPFNAYLKLSGDPAKKIDIALNNITYEGENIESLKGILDAGKKTLNLSNEPGNINIFSRLDKYEATIEIRSYDINYLAALIRRVSGLALGSGVISYAFIVLRASGDHSVTAELEGLDIAGLRDIRVTIEKGQPEAQFALTAFYRDAVLKGRFDEKGLKGRLSGHYSSGAFRVEFTDIAAEMNRDGLVFLDMNPLQIKMDRYTADVSGKMYYKNSTLIFDHVRFLDGDFHGTMDLHKNSKIDSRIDLSVLDKNLPSGVAISIGKRQEHFFILLDHDILKCDLIFKKTVEINGLMFKKDGITAAFDGTFGNGVLSGESAVKGEHFEVSGNIFLKAEEKEGTFFVHNLRLPGNEFNDSYVNFRLSGDIAFTGALGAGILFSGTWSRGKYFINASLDAAVIDLGEKGIWKISGSALLNNRDAPELTCDISGESSGFEASGQTIGQFSFNTVFRYAAGVLNLNFFYIDGVNLRTYGKGIYKSAKEMKFLFNSFAYRKENFSLTLSGEVDIFGGIRYLDIRDIKLVSGGTLALKRLLWTAGPSGAFSAESLVLNLFGQKIGGDIKGNIGNGIFSGEHKDLFIGGTAYAGGPVSVEPKGKGRFIINIKETVKKALMPIIEANVRFSGDEVLVDDLYFHREKGSLFARGTLGGNISLYLKLEDFPLRSKQPFFSCDILAGGEINAGGSFLRPDIFFDISSEKGSVNELKYKECRFRGRIADNILFISDLMLQTERSKISAPDSAKIYLKKKKSMEDYFLSLSGFLSVTDLSRLLPGLFSSGKGNFEFSMTLRPYAEVPVVGRMAVDGQSSLKEGFDNIKAENFTFQIDDEGSITHAGKIIIAGNPVSIRKSGDSAIDFEFSEFTRFSLSSIGLSTFVKGKVTVDLEKGISVASSGLYAKEGFLRYDPFQRQGGAGLLPVSLDLNVSFEEVRLMNSFYSGLISGEAMITGEVPDVLFEGKVNSSEGQLKFFGRDFNVENANLTLGDNPRINVNASGTFSFDRQYFVTINIFGDPFNPQMAISSNPEMNTDELKGKLFSEGSIATGLDILISKYSGPSGGFIGRISFMLQKYVQFSGFNVKISNPLLGGTETDISVGITGHLDRFSLDTKLAFFKYNDSYKFSPEFNIGFKVNKNLELDLNVGGKDSKIVFAPTIRF